ncbi:MAG: M20/M25/M40 family metallo-hydrolase [Anaerolineae bacterium]|nr:M20/M25/M40 family metallo-hydrolase [Anaerolineae bacterium]
MPSRYAIDTMLTTQYLQQMVQIDSVNPGLAADGVGEGAVAEWLYQTCLALGLEVEFQETAPNRPNVIARWVGTGGGKSLLLTGHTDVVSTANMQGNPFDGRIEDGRLYGRGSYDMKGGLASILGAVAALKADHFQPAGDIWLGFVTDEEYLSLGTDALVTAIQPDAAILTEPTDVQICVAHKGFAWLTLTTYGLAAHGSRYMDGVDAITHMQHLLNMITTLEQQVFEDDLHPLLGRNSVHASLISGGLGLSTYPDQCSLQIEHRYLPDLGADEIVQLWQDEIDDLTKTIPNFKATVKLDFERPGYEIERAAPIVQTMHHAFSQVMETEPTYMGMYAWLDSAIMGRAGIPTVILGPGGKGMHAAVEYVNLEDVFACAAIIAQATADWVG